MNNHKEKKLYLQCMNQYMGISNHKDKKLYLKLMNQYIKRIITKKNFTYNEWINTQEQSWKKDFTCNE